MRLFRKNKNKKSKTTIKMTLEDCVKLYKENPQYRYVVVVGKEKIPRSLNATMEGAENDLRTHLMSDGELLAGVIDLMFYQPKYMEKQEKSKSMLTKRRGEGEKHEIWDL